METGGDNPYTLARRSVLLKRCGREEEALALLEFHDHPMTRAQHALNILDCGKYAASAAGRAEQARKALGPPHVHDNSPQSLEQRARWEVANAIINKLLGCHEEARLGFARAGVLAEMYGDDSFAQQAKYELETINHSAGDRIEYLIDGLRRAEANADPVQITGAALRLIEAAWSEGRIDAIELAVALLPEDHPDRRAYASFHEMAINGQPPRCGFTHPIDLLTHTMWDTAAALSARERMEHERSRAIARIALDRRASSYFLAELKIWGLMMEARLHDILSDYTRSAAALDEARRLLSATAVAAHALTHAYEIEARLWQASPPHDQLKASSESMYTLSTQVPNAEQMQLMGRLMLAYAPHALSHLNSRMQHPILSQDAVLHVRRRDEAEGILDPYSTLCPTRKTRHQLRLAKQDGQFRKVLLRTHLETLKQATSGGVPKQKVD